MSRLTPRAFGHALALMLLFGCLPVLAATSQPVLYSIGASAPRVLAQGAQKSWPIKISEDNALGAVFQGGMWLPTPSGGRVYAKYARHIVHANGIWTWVGTVDTVHGAQQVVLTFGKDGVFGLIPQASGYPLRIVTSQGETRVIETSAAAMARSTQTLRLRSQRDYAIPPRVAPKGDENTLAMRAAADAAVRQAAASSGPVTIDVMVAYTQGFANMLGGQSLALTRIQNLVDITNQAYLDSGVNQQIRLVYTTAVSYPDNTANQSALDEITGIDEHGNSVSIPASLANIASLRAQYGADLVVMMRSYDNSTQSDCGVGWLVGGDQTQIKPDSNVYGYSVVSDGSSGGYYCLDTTFAHELGHNMGDAHDRANAEHSGAYPYSYGYLGNGKDGFSTIMAYGTDTDTPLAVFSNPNISVCQNTPCGVADSSSSSADNVHSMNNTAALIAAFEPTMMASAPGFPTASMRNDVNGDGKSDLLWMNTQTSTFGYWLMNGAGILNLWSTPVAAGYRMVATGDFNGDGRVDLIWTSSKNDLYLWSSNGTAFVAEYLGRYQAGDQVVGTGDVNGDGKSDLLFVNSATHSLRYWLMTGGNIISAFSTPVAPGYTIGAIGDFNGDGRVDLVWTSVKRDLYLWESNGIGFDSYYAGTYPAGWSLAGAGDVNGDGLADLLWRNQGAGLFGFWVMNGPRQVSGWAVSAAGAYQVAAVGDFNGDRKVDVMWTSAADDLYLWTSNGNGFNTRYAGTYPAGWKIIPSQVMAAGKP